jgi:hypothetical protein
MLPSQIDNLVVVEKRKEDIDFEADCPDDDFVFKQDDNLNL